MHSWSMLAVKGSRVPSQHPSLSDNSIIFHTRDPHSPHTAEIPGNPDLVAHGELILVDGGLAFDGRDSHAVAQIPADDCIINPEGCPEGLSFGTKLKFDNQLLSVDEPRYIIDTGANKPDVRGFSLFVQQGKLYAVVRSAEREWMVRVSCALDTLVIVQLLHTITEPGWKIRKCFKQE